MEKFVTIKTNADKTGRIALYRSWAEKMLVQNLAEKGFKIDDTEGEYRVCGETEKAYKLHFKPNELYRHNRMMDDTYGNSYDVYCWMPKSAFVA